MPRFGHVKQMGQGRSGEVYGEAKTEDLLVDRGTGGRAWGRGQAVAAGVGAGPGRGWGRVPVPVVDSGNISLWREAASAGGWWREP